MNFDDYHIGIPELDNEHKLLLVTLEIIKKTLSLYRLDEGKLKPHLDNLVARVKSHNANEERYLLKSNFVSSVLQEHKAHHKALETELEACVSRPEDRELYGKLENFLLLHFMEDAKILCPAR
jgi:hemerythrin-like metal-binding protein